MSTTCRLTGMLLLLRKSRRASRAPRVEAWTNTPRSASFMLPRALLSSLAVSSFSRSTSSGFWATWRFRPAGIVQKLLFSLMFYDRPDYWHSDYWQWRATFLVHKLSPLCLRLLQRLLILHMFFFPNIFFGVFPRDLCGSFVKRLK